MTRDEKRTTYSSEDAFSRWDKLSAKALIFQVVAGALFAQGQLSVIEGPSVVLLIPQSGNSLRWDRKPPVGRPDPL